MPGSSSQTSRLINASGTPVQPGCLGLVSGGASGPTYLLDFHDAIFTRASEAAFTDAREGAFADTTAYGSSETPLSDFNAWSKGGSPIITASGVTDPDGGTSAYTIEDDAVGALESVVVSGVNAMYPGGRYRWTYWILKDTVESRFPEVAARNSTASQQYSVQVNTKTGAHAVRVNTGFSAGTTTITEVAGWWKIVLDVTSGANAGTIYWSIAPAAGTVLGVSNIAAVGTVTAYRPQGFWTAAWKGVDEPRIFSDGSILIEGARTNYVTSSADASAWTTGGTITRVAGSAAPDGSTSAWRIGDADAAASSYLGQGVGATGATGAHCYSVKVLKDTDETRFPEFQVFQGTAVITGGNLGIQINTKTGATNTRTGTPTSVTVLDDGAWWRLVVVFAVSTAGSMGCRAYPAATDTLGTLVGTVQGETTAWGVQLEVGAFPTSPIRTAGAIGTRAVDAANDNADVSLDSGRWSVTITLDGGSDAPNSGAFTDMGLFTRTSSATNTIYLRASTTAPVFRMTVNSVLLVNQAVSWVAGAELTITVDWDAREVTLAGFTAGDGTYALGGVDTWALAADDKLFVGALTAIGGNPFFGVIGRPVAA